MTPDAHPQPLTLLTPAAPADELAACEGDTCLVPGARTGATTAAGAGKVAPAISTTQE